MRLTIDISDNQANRVIDAFASLYSYPEQVQDPNVTDRLEYIPNPQSKAQYARQCIINHVKRVVREYETAEARKAIVISDPDVT